MDNIYSPYFVDALEITEDKQSWDIFANKFMGLPEKIKDVMLGSEVVESIALNLSLTENQSANLSRLIRDVLLADFFIGDMKSEIINRLSVDASTALEIQNKTINELFAPAIEDIKKMQREKFPSRVGQGSPVPAAQPARPSAPSALVPPPPPSMQNTPPVNQSNVINLRNNQQQTTDDSQP